MRRSLSVLIACSALALVAGCGSSGNPSSSSSSSASSSTAKTTSTSGGLKPDTTPKYGSPEPSSPVQSGTVQVAYRNIAINPDTIKVKVGSTIKWTNYDSVEHNVTSEGGPQKFASKDFGEGGTYEIKANEPGIIHYECTIHPASMNGTIEVVK
jgi:plastocyanin